MFEEKIIKKVPGKLCPNPKESQGYIENFNSKTKGELLELLERQDKLLSNKCFLNKLPDKGEKIKEFRENIAKALAENDQLEKTCGLLSGLTLSKHNVADEIEWTGKFTGILNDNSGGSSDEETDPLKIIASHAGTGSYKKKYRHLKEQEKLSKDLNGSHTSSSLILPEEELNEQKHDCASIESSSHQDCTGNSENKPCDDYVTYLCNKVDGHQENKKTAFKPHCTTKSGVHPGLFVPKHKGPHWEVTAATPPPPVHGAAKLLSLQESLQLQQQQVTNLKVVQAKHASEKLATNSSVKLGTALPDLSARKEYRESSQVYDSSSSSDEEENDGQSDEDDKRDTIVYTYTE